MLSITALKKCILHCNHSITTLHRKEMGAEQRTDMLHQMDSNRASTKVKVEPNILKQISTQNRQITHAMLVLLTEEL